MKNMWDIVGPFTLSCFFMYPVFKYLIAKNPMIGKVEANFVRQLTRPSGSTMGWLRESPALTSSVDWTIDGWDMLGLLTYTACMCIYIYIDTCNVITLDLIESKKGEANRKQLGTKCTLLKTTKSKLDKAKHNSNIYLQRDQVDQFRNHTSPHIKYIKSSWVVNSSYFSYHHCAHQALSSCFCLSHEAHSTRTCCRTSRTRGPVRLRSKFPDPWQNEQTE